MDGGERAAERTKELRDFYLTKKGREMGGREVQRYATLEGKAAHIAQKSEKGRAT